jgi:hypothetical protein
MKISRLGVNNQARYFFDIHDKLMQWNYEPISGKGLVARFTGSDAYAHIELIISQSSNGQSEIVWNIDDSKIPNNFGHKPYIEEVLSFFTSYISGIKGKKIDLNFEINNISFHIVDTKARHFFEATMRAIISCFDLNIFPFNEILVERISKQTIENRKQNKMYILRSEIIKSLQNDSITERFSKILNKENIELKMLNGIHFNSYIRELFDIRKTLLDENDVKYLQGHNAIDYDNRLTDIGKAHIAKSLNDYYDLNYHFDIQMQDFM